MKDQDTVYMVLAHDYYYPAGDNTQGVFHSKDDAEAFLKKIEENDPYYKRDVYHIVKWEVQ